MNKKYLLFFFLFALNSHICQNYKVILDKLTRLEEDGVHIVTFEKEKESLILPSISINETKIEKYFLSLFYSFDTEDDELISVMVIKTLKDELLYIDKNNDNNLTNDGNPIIFPNDKDSISFNIVASNDQNQKLRLALFRKPDIPDSLQEKFLDSDGNINPIFLKFARIYSNNINFEGKKRTFYFDYRISLRQGFLHIQNSKYKIGLFDYTNNGKFNDSEDLLIIDYYNEGKLNLEYSSNVFMLNDIFQIENKSYKIKEIDKYGNFLIVDETNENPTNKYLKKIQSQLSTTQKEDILPSNFWNKKLQTLDGKDLLLESYKGKYLFVNIWGEWCKPCIDEFDELKIVYENFKEKVDFLGIIKINKIENVNKVITQKKITWKNTILSDEIKNQFNVKTYPMNILIFPDGEKCIITQSVNREFFEINIK